MTILEAAVLGFVQGVGEFLPISSSGHLVLFQRIFGISEGAMSFDIAVHLGTLAALIAVMRKRLLMYIKNPLGRVPVMVVVGTIPTAAIAFVLEKIISSLFESGASLGMGFLLTASLLWFAETWSGRMAARRERSAGRGIGEANVGDALAIGIAQGVATVPAISRSGSTIAAGLVCGLGREAAVEYAFLLSIPATLLAVANDILGMATGSGAAGATAGATAGAAASAAAASADAASAAAGVGALPTVVGVLVSMAVGFPAAQLMLRRIRKINLKWFAAYAFALGALILVDQLFIGVLFG